MRPRHYVLIALLLGVFVFNMVRARHRNAVAPMPANATVGTISETQFAWTQYEHAAALKDAPAAQYAMALQTFDNAFAHVPSTPGAHDRSDMETCRMWLQQYRSPSTGSMHSMAPHHVDTCAHDHVDRAN